MVNLTARHKGIAFFLVNVLCTHLADVFIKHSAYEVHVAQEAFLKFLFAAILLLPCWLYLSAKKKKHKINHPFQLSVSAVALSSATLLWFYGVKTSPINVVTIMAFTIPPLILLSAFFILRKPISKLSILATLMGFCGVLTVISHSDAMSMTLGVACLFIAAILFSTYSVMNEKIAETESTIVTVFFTSVIAAIVISPLAFTYWQSIAISSLYPYIFLAVISIASIFALIKAYQHERATFLAPLIYSEMLLSLLSGYYIFDEFLTFKLFLGFMLIAASNTLLFRTH